VYRLQPQVEGPFEHDHVALSHSCSPLELLTLPRDSVFLYALVKTESRAPKSADEEHPLLSNHAVNQVRTFKSWRERESEKDKGEKEKGEKEK
jgi:hypothetical protein